MTAADVLTGPLLTLRHPTPADEDTWVRLHRDPRLYTHAPHAMPPTDEDAEAGFAVVLRDWESGLGYWALCDTSDEVVGFVGAAPASARGSGSSTSTTWWTRSSTAGGTAARQPG